MSEDGTTNRAYCSHCGTERPVRVTVPWQADLCTHCGQDITTDAN